MSLKSKKFTLLVKLRLRQQTIVCMYYFICRFRHVSKIKEKMFKNQKSPFSFGDLLKIRYMNYTKTSKLS